jgi:hypothetical protein
LKQHLNAASTLPTNQPGNFIDTLEEVIGRTATGNKIGAQAPIIQAAISLLSDWNGSPQQGDARYFLRAVHARYQELSLDSFSLGAFTEKATWMTCQTKTHSAETCEVFTMSVHMRQHSADSVVDAQNDLHYWHRDTRESRCDECLENTQHDIHRNITILPTVLFVNITKEFTPSQESKAIKVNKTVIVNDVIFHFKAALIYTGTGDRGHYRSVGCNTQVHLYNDAASQSFPDGMNDQLLDNILATNSVAVLYEE